MFLNWQYAYNTISSLNFYKTAEAIICYLIQKFTQIQKFTHLVKNNCWILLSWMLFYDNAINNLFTAVADR